jgi:thiamine biosynthesis lipoprotein
MSTVPAKSWSDHQDRVVGRRRVVSVMGTVFTLELSDLDPTAAAVDRVVAWWRWVDDTFSTYRPDSEISRLAAGTLTLEECVPEVRHILNRCAEAARLSSGYFSDHPDGRLDPSGMVKGWSVATASEMLSRAGSRGHCISAGGDVWCTGIPAPGERWRVGVVDPHDSTRLLAVVDAPPDARGLAVATSGTAERGQHILNPHSGHHPDDLASITVTGSDLTHVDWVATAAFAMGHDSRAWLEEMDDVEAYAVTPDGDYWCTLGFEKLAEITALPSAK